MKVTLTDKPFNLLMVVAVENRIRAMAIERLLVKKGLATLDEIQAVRNAVSDERMADLVNDFRKQFLETCGRAGDFEQCRTPGIKESLLAPFIWLHEAVSNRFKG